LTIVEEIEKHVRAVLDEMNIELVELQYSKSKRTLLRIFVWEEGGITIDRCTKASRKISDLLDSKDIMRGRYFLEVSSPGLQRPLVTERDFERNIGEKIKVTKTVDDKHDKVVGKLTEVRGGQIVLSVDNAEQIIDTRDVVSAKIVVEINPS